MKNYRILLILVIVLTFILGASMILDTNDVKQTRPERGKIIAESLSDYEDTQYIGRICEENEPTGQLSERKKKKFKIKKKEMPCWFQTGCDEWSDWVTYILIEPQIVGNDTINIEIIGYEKAVYGKTCDD